MRTLLALVLSFVPLTAIAGHEIAPREIVPAPYAIRVGSTAFAANRFLTVLQYDNPGTHIVGVLHDRDGKRISSEWFPILPSVGRIDYLQLVGVDDAFALFWRSADENFLAIIDADGKVTRRVRLDIGKLVQFTVAWNGTSFLFISRPDFAANHVPEGILLDREGRVVRHTAVADHFFTRTIARTDDGFALAVVSGNGVFAQAISNSGVASTPIKIETLTQPQSIISAAAGDDALVVWSAGVDARTLKSVFIHANGTTTTPRQLLPGAFAEADPIHLMPTSDGYLLVFASRGAVVKDVWTVLLDRDGIARTDPVKLTTAAPNFRAASNDRVTLLISNAEKNNVVRSHAIASDGSASDPEVVSLAHARQIDPAILAVNDRLVATWSESSADQTITRGALLTGDGVPSSNFPVATDTAFAAKDLAAIGNEILVLGKQGERLVGTRMTADGVRIDRAPFLIAEGVDEDAPSIVTAGNQWLIAWSRRNVNPSSLARTLFTTTVTREGVVAPPREVKLDVDVPAGYFRSPQRPSLAFDGREALIVWAEFQGTSCPYAPCNAPGRNVVFAARLEASGTPLDSSPTETGMEWQDNVATSGNEFAIVGRGAVTFVYTRGGAISIGPSRKLIDYPYFPFGDITWDGDEYVVAFHYGAFNTYLTLHRITANGLDTMRPLYTSAFPNDGSRNVPPSIAVAGAHAVIAVDEVVPADTGHVVVYNENEMQPRVDPPLPPTFARSSSLLWRPIDVAWEHPGGDVEGFVIEALGTDGIWRMTAIVSASERHVLLQYASQPVRVRAFNAGGSSAPLDAPPQPRRRSTNH